MQIPSIPMPTVTSAVPQDLAAKAVPNVQATQPLIQNAVGQSPKNEKSHHSRSNKERGRDGRGDGDQKSDSGGDEDHRGSSINISV